MALEIIGRDEELSVVHAFLDGPIERPRVLVLEGDAGIGKSTLWSAAVAGARERSFHVLTSRPAEAKQTLAHVVLSDLFAETAPDVVASLPAPRRNAFEAALLREEPGGPLDPRALGAAIITLMPLVAHGRPLVLAIDDDQWADASSVATLRFALRRSLGVPMLLVLSRRADGASATSAEDAVDRSNVTRIRVGPLSMGAIQALLRSRMEATFSRPTLLRLHEASGGNPFYALELARARTAGQDRDPMAPLDLPASLEGLLASRFQGLDPRTRWALLLVAAQGRSSARFLHALDIGSRELDRARAASVVEIADGVVRFTHPLLASALYQRTPDEARRAAHRLLASVIDDPLDRARHLALGRYEPSAELAAELESAAAVATDRGMPIVAAELGEHALRLTPPDALDDRHRRAIATARAHLEGGEGGRARALADEVLARASAGPRRAEALVLMSDLEDFGPAFGHLEQALPEAAAEPALEAAIHARLADLGGAVGDRIWAEPHARASLRIAEQLNDDALRVTALSTLAGIRSEGGDPSALELAERAYRLARGLGDPRLMRSAASSLGFVLTFSGHTERAREWLEVQLDELGDRDEVIRYALLMQLAVVEVWSGRWSVASDYAEQVQEIGAQYGESAPDHLATALVALHRGEFAIARAHSRRAISMGKDLLLPQHLAILGVCDLWDVDATAALPNLVRAEQAADLRGWEDPNRRWWRAEHAEALLQLGRVDDAARLVAGWEEAAARLGRERVLALALRCRGLIASARGQPTAAIDLLREAAERHEAVGDPFGRARALLALGIVRRRARQKRAARAALEDSRAAFEALGAVSWAGVARAELARIGGRERIEGLTPSEIRVAGLAAEGRTNGEIAAALFLGERTVASHLTHIYAKLGVRSRTELARRVPPNPSPVLDPSKVQTS